ncbi:DUF2339 domain-containing protein [Psychromonas antarctica]|uniref:DUF2339 domain-containing protein n=1 Tax=Psychromonas antarctica TaxID=67573 RepID=UPI001EE847E0|nr:DUF2339 domain-containing protein [Psychromonas antarctica]MCG6200797.1 DUF2339 domain-containing protein [Psychromonas antarctica]
MQLKDELSKLKVELAELRSVQGQQQQSIETRLDLFSAKLDQLSQIDRSFSSVADKEIVNAHRATKYDRQYLQSQQIDISELNSEHSIQHDCITVDPSLQSEPITQKTPLSIKKSSATRQQKTALIEKNVKKLSQPVGLLRDLFAEFSDSIFAPLAGMSAQIKSFYQHYQAKGLGPVFLMTVAGIITLTLGFGYLLQYSINNWFSELAKALFSFACANAILIGAIVMYKKRSGMEDFASGLLGLGIILNYLSAYFIGPYFELLPTAVSFSLLLLITLLGFAISLQLETKVVSIVTLVGGSLAPLMLLSTSQAPLLYIPYLLLIGCCALWQSRLLKWPVLMEITTLLHIACIEFFTLYLGEPLTLSVWQEVVAVLSVNAIFYLYALTGIVWLYQEQRDSLFSRPPSDVNIKAVALSKRVLALPFALLAFVLLVSHQLTVFSGELLLANSLICAVLFTVFKGSKQLRAISLLFAGSFAGFAALQLISDDFLGLVLLLEGLLLLWLGVKEHSLSVRSEAYFLLATGLIVNVWGLIETLPLSRYSLSDFSPYRLPLITLLLSAGALYIASALISKLLLDTKNRRFIAAECKILMVVKELLSVSYVLCLLFIGSLVSYDYYLNSVPLLSLLLLHLAAKDKLKFTELLAWLLMLPLCVLVAFAISDVGSGSFSVQPLYAQLARIELFVSLLTAYYWYKRTFADSKIIKLAYYLQLLCFIVLPLLFLPKVLLHFTGYISIAVWISCFISLALARFVRHRALIVQGKILTLVAIVLTAATCLAEIWTGLVALMLGAIFMAILAYRYLQMAILSRLVLRLQWQLAPFYFALLIGVMVHTAMSFWQANWAVVAGVLCSYFALLISRRPVPKVLHAGYAAAYALLFVCAIAPLLMHTQRHFGINTQSLLYILCEVSTLTILAKLIIHRGAAIRLHRRMLSLTRLHWGWHIFLSLNYLLWSYQLTDLIAAPLSAILLVTHASWLMFISLRPEYRQSFKLAAGVFAVACIKVLLIDMANFEAVQKVIAFIMIGSILLSVSYFYQKARQRLAASR